MEESFRERLRRWRVEDVLLAYPGLRLFPSREGDVTIAGDLQFRAKGPAGDVVEDTFTIRIDVGLNFPKRLPTAREMAGRIPETFHKLKDGALCLGAPTEQRMILTLSPTLMTFVEKLLIPYLFGFSYFSRHGVMPFGELSHGEEGIREFLATLFGSVCGPDIREFLRLASLRKRQANKLPCPCESGNRLGRCHNRRVNRLRKSLGRSWFRKEYLRLIVRK